MKPMKIDLSGRVAVVTGGTGDLGRVICRALDACGARVAVHYHGNAAKAAELVAELHGAIAVQADVTDAASVGRMRDAIVSQLGAADIIVNNAVIQYEPKRPVLEQPIADYESQFRSCAIHNVLMAQAFVPAMIERRWGRVIGINTECAMLYNELHSAYVSGKRAMDGVLRVLAREVGQHEVTVNQVAPGFMISDRERAMNRTVLEGYDEHVPMKRRGLDDDVANAVAFLASDLARFITGAFLPVCGGHVMPAI
jgi:3-oxoacyl-[acyl-carrier protein] reductase